MKKNDLADLKGKTEGELKRMLLDFKNDIGKERIDMALKKSKSTNTIGNKKRNIARILTILSVKKFATKNLTEPEISKSLNIPTGGGQ